MVQTPFEQEQDRFSSEVEIAFIIARKEIM